MKYISILFCLIVAFSQNASCQIITTIAGDGDPGYNGDNIAATSARLQNPPGIAIDGSGNMYIADATNNRIRMVNAAGIITTIAGNGTAGYTGDNIAATDAELYTPLGVAIDGSGNVYFSDGVNQRVRKIDASGIITTIAGNGTAGYNGDNIAATDAEIDRPQGVAVDGSGNVYIADQSNHRIRMVNAAGIITTIAGNGTGGYNGDNMSATAAELYYPQGVAVDGSGNVYIADASNNRIRIINTAGIITTIAGTDTAGYNGDNIAATAAELHTPIGIAINGSGDIYVSDGNNERVRKINTDGIITTICGDGLPYYNGDNIPATAAELRSPAGIAFDGSGNIYIADANSNRIRKITSVPGSVGTVAAKTLQITIAPNPVTDDITISYTAVQSGVAEVVLMNMLGETLYSQQLYGQQSGKTIVPMRLLAAGMYMIRFTCGDEQALQRVVKN